MNEEKWYLNITYPELKDIILESIANMTREFVAVGYYLKYVRDHEMYLADGYASIWEFAEDLYGIQRSTCSRWMAINDRFSVQGNSPVLDDRYRQYGKSQLQEMLYLDDKQMEEVKPEMTVKDIREIRKPEPIPEAVEVAEIREPDPVEQIPGQMGVEDYPEILPDEEQEAVELDTVCDVAHDETVEPVEDVVIEAATEVVEEPKQLELPKLRNNTQREEWLNNYQDWGLWYYDNHIDVNYYKYDFADGSRLVVAEYPQREHEWSWEPRDEHYYHLLEKNRKKAGSTGGTYDSKYMQNTDSKTYLVEFLKNLQKGEK